MIIQYTLLWLHVLSRNWHCFKVAHASTENVPHKFHQVTWKFNKWTGAIVKQEEWLFHASNFSKFVPILRSQRDHFWLLKSLILHGPNHRLLPLLHCSPNKTNTQKSHLSSYICYFFFMTFRLNVYNLPFGSFVFVLVYLAIPRPGLSARLTDSL